MECDEPVEVSQSQNANDTKVGDADFYILSRFFQNNFSNDEISVVCIVLKANTSFFWIFIIYNDVFGLQIWTDRNIND